MRWWGTGCPLEKNRRGRVVFYPLPMAVGPLFGVVVVGRVAVLEDLGALREVVGEGC